MAAIKYKGTDGQWHLLNNILVSGINVVQTTGSSSADVMSQSAVTEAINSKQIEVDQTIDSGTSASTNAVSTSAVYGFVTSYTPSITVDQVLDNTTSASTNPVSSKAVYKAATDNELVWTNAFVALSGAVSSHTENTEIHVTDADKNKLHTHDNKSLLDAITGSVGTMAYENKTSYYTKSETSGATEISTALGKKSNTGHTHTSNEITAMTNYTSGSTNTPIQTSDTLNQAIGKLEHSLGGINLIALTQQQYDDLATKNPTTLYIITDN